MRDQETEISRKFNPNAFDTLENTQFLSEGVFPYQKKMRYGGPSSNLSGLEKRKIIVSGREIAINRSKSEIGRK